VPVPGGTAGSFPATEENGAGPWTRPHSCPGRITRPGGTTPRCPVLSVLDPVVHGGGAFTCQERGRAPTTDRDDRCGDQGRQRATGGGQIAAGGVVLDHFVARFLLQGRGTPVVERTERPRVGEVERKTVLALHVTRLYPDSQPGPDALALPVLVIVLESGLVDDEVDADRNFLDESTFLVEDLHHFLHTVVSATFQGLHGFSEGGDVTVLETRLGRTVVLGIGRGDQVGHGELDGDLLAVDVGGTRLPLPRIVLVRRRKRKGAGIGHTRIFGVLLRCLRRPWAFGGLGVLRLLVGGILLGLVVARVLLGYVGGLGALGARFRVLVLLRGVRFGLLLGGSVTTGVVGRRRRIDHAEFDEVVHGQSKRGGLHPGLGTGSVLVDQGTALSADLGVVRQWAEDV